MSRAVNGTVSRTAGVPHAAVEFYAELEANNTREWFAHNKDRYERSVRQPLLALTDALADEFGAATVFRPYRDVRFRADKTPLKTEQAAVVEGAGSTGGADGTGYYLEVSASGLTTGGGAAHLAADQLARMREAVDDDELGPQLQRLVDDLRSARFSVGGDLVATRPRGVPADHPRLELMRHKSLIAWRDHGTPAWMATATVVRRVREDWRAIRPLLDWLQAHVGPSTVPTERRRPG